MPRLIQFSISLAVGFSFPFIHGSGGLTSPDNGECFSRPMVYVVPVHICAIINIPVNYVLVSKAVIC